MADEDAINVGSLLVERGLITQEQLKQVLAAVDKTNQSFQQTIIGMGFVTKENICTAIAEGAGVPYVDLSNYLIDPKVLELVPEKLARAHKVFPLFKISDTLTVAIADPTDLVGLDQVRSKSGYEVESCVSAEADITQAVEQSYGTQGAVKELIGDIGEGPLEKGETAATVMDVSGEAPIAQLVNLIITQAMHDRASDIHIEPDEELLRIRFRVDGILYEIPSPPKNLELAIISRIKVLSNMDIAETRVPQDGHFQMAVDNKQVDLRVSTIPTIYGENLVLRLLDVSSVLLGLEKLGFSSTSLKNFEELIARPYGIVLVTGPTGCGKTTTLYSALNRINSIDRNIITIEDPVEYRLGLIRQIQVNPKAGVTFANGLRAILRQDPNVIMVGEIRDLETARISVQAALTGHLVFSTLHTNDAPSAITRLIDMGVEPFLISASVAGVVAQRLVRTICPKCKEAFEPAKSLIQGLGLDESDKKVKFYKGKGCNHCKGTGYKGRIGIFEMMLVTDTTKEMIVKEESTAIALKRKAQEEGMEILREDGLKKVVNGITTIEEVSRVTEERVDIGRRAEGQVEVKRVAVEAAQKPEEKVEAEKIRIPKPADLDSYQKKITNWLARKK